MDIELRTPNNKKTRAPVMAHVPRNLMRRDVDTASTLDDLQFEK